jgi:tetratricopeptide (TPR) repeat protein
MPVTMAYYRRVIARSSAVLCFVLLLTSSARLLRAQSSTSLAQPNPPKASAQDALNRVRADLFSAAPHLQDDVRDLKEILGANPRSVEAHVLLGIAYRGLGTQEMLAEAVAELRQAIEIDPGFAPARFFLAHVYLDLGRPARAKEELEAALEKVPGNPQFMASLGEAERQLNNPRKAIEIIRHALQADPSLAEAHYYLGLALLNAGELPDAVKELEQVVQSGAGRPEAFLALGTVYTESKRLDDAVMALTQGTKLDPARADLRIQLARAYRLKGQLDKAELELNRARPKPNSLLAPSYTEHEQLEFDLYTELGLVKMKRGQYGAAAEAFKKVLAMDPDHGPTNNRLAEVYLQQGLFKLASEHAARASRAGYPLPEAEQQLIRAGLGGKKPGVHE